LDHPARVRDPSALSRAFRSGRRASCGLTQGRGVPVTFSHASRRSWPGLSPPSTSCLPKDCKKAVDARDKRRHDGARSDAISPELRSDSKLAQGHLLNRMVSLLSENETGAPARGQDVFVQIDKVDPRPDRSCGGARLGVAQLRVTVEIGFRITKRGLLQRKKTLNVPLHQHVFVGV